MSRAVLSIGSNLSDPVAQLQSVPDGMRAWLRAVSGVYETPPWGPVQQDNFLNAVVLVEGPFTPYDWLAKAHTLEQAAGRRRELRWGPRTLDVDVVSVVDVDGMVRSDDPELTLPHPRAHERAFVLVPWLAVDPAAALADGSVADLLARLPAAEVAEVRLRADVVLT